MAPQHTIMDQMRNEGTKIGDVKEPIDVEKRAHNTCPREQQQQRRGSIRDWKWSIFRLNESRAHFSPNTLYMYDYACRCVPYVCTVEWGLRDNAGGFLNHKSNLKKYVLKCTYLQHNCSYLNPPALSFHHCRNAHTHLRTQTNTAQRMQWPRH